MAFAGLDNYLTSDSNHTSDSTTSSIIINTNAQPYIIKAAVNGIEKESIKYVSVGYSVDYDSYLTSSPSRWLYAPRTSVTLGYENGSTDTLYAKNISVNKSDDYITISGIFPYATISSDSISGYVMAAVPPADRYRAMIMRNMTPDLNARNGELMRQNGNAAEIRARRLLRDMVGEREFRRYLVRGFIVCKGRSGVLYRIHGGHGMVYSFVKGADGKFKMFEQFCVQFKDSSLPFTDAVIMRKLLVENDEFGLRAAAHVSKAPLQAAAPTRWVPRPLVEVA